MKLVFAGTPEFARVALAALHAAGHDIALVLTQPDRPAGRGLKSHASMVKAWSVEHGLCVEQPRSLRLDGRYADDARAAQAALASIAPEAMVVAAYGLILPPWVLELPRLGCLNVHGSLLPRWRGAAPIQRALEAGDTRTGITIMQMDAGLDTGPMLLAESEDIRADDSTGTLHDRLAVVGAQLIVQVLALAARGELAPQRQSDEGVKYAHKVHKAEARIDWSHPATEIERRARAFDPFPGCHFQHGEQPIKLWRAQLAPGGGAPGSVLPSAAGRCVVACGDGALELLELQAAGGKRMSAAMFLRSHAWPAGLRLS